MIPASQATDLIRENKKLKKERVDCDHTITELKNTISDMTQAGGRLQYITELRDENKRLRAEIAQLKKDDKDEKKE